MRRVLLSLSFIFLLMSSSLFLPLSSASVLITGYDEDDNYVAMQGACPDVLVCGLAETVWLNNSYTITEIRWELNKVLAPTGYLKARIEGVNSTGYPDGVVYGVSTTTLDISTILTTTQWWSFSFNNIHLNALNYSLFIWIDSGVVDAANYVRVRSDNTLASYRGDFIPYTLDWASMYPTWDASFAVYGDLGTGSNEVNDYLGNFPDENGGIANTNSSSGWEFEQNWSTYFVMERVTTLNSMHLVEMASGGIVLGDDYDGTLYMALYVTSADMWKLGEEVNVNNALYLRGGKCRWVRPEAGNYTCNSGGFQLQVGQTVALAVSGDSNNLVINDTVSGSTRLYNTTGIMPMAIHYFELIDAASPIAMWVHIKYRDSGTISGDDEDYFDELTALIGGQELANGAERLLGLIVWARDWTGMDPFSGGIAITWLWILVTSIVLAYWQADTKANFPPQIYVINAVGWMAMFMGIGFLPTWVGASLILITAVLSAPLWSGRK